MNNGLLFCGTCHLIQWPFWVFHWPEPDLSWAMQLCVVLLSENNFVHYMHLSVFNHVYAQQDNTTFDRCCNSLITVQELASQVQYQLKRQLVVSRSLHCRSVTTNTRRYLFPDRPQNKFSSSITQLCKADHLLKRLAFTRLIEDAASEQDVKLVHYHTASCDIHMQQELFCQFFWHSVWIRICK